MAPKAELSKSLESLLAAAVDRNVAPGLSAIAFNREGVVAAAATGHDGTGKDLSLDTIIWVASCGKLGVSLLTLIVCEKFGVDIDSHEELVKFVPELGKDHEGSKDEEGNWKFRPASPTAPLINVRHLLNHCSGSGYFFSSEEGAWRMTQPGGADLGSDLSLNVPRLWEVDEKWEYNMGCDWLAVIIPRITGMHLRESFRKYLFDPLGLAPDTIDIFRTPVMDSKKGEVVMRGENDTWVSLPTPFDTPQFEGEPPKGQNPLTSAPIWCTIGSYAAIIQSLLDPEGPKDTNGKPLLSKEMWERACKDDLAETGKSAEQRPFIQSAIPHMANSLEWWKKPKEIKEGSRHPVGWSLLQTSVLREESETGLQPGTLTWAGLANSYYFIDREQGIGSVVSTQTFPWADPAVVELRDEVERWTVQNKV